MSKKILLIALTVTFLFILSACGDKKEAARKAPNIPPPSGIGPTSPPNFTGPSTPPPSPVY